MNYRGEIDGLRALAVVPVILFHAGFNLFSGGFIGVDVFFVISGYLITTMLIEDIESNSFSLIKFYERRARRILPALFFVMGTCIPLAWMWMLPSQMKDFSQSFVAVSLFASNILFWLESGYFAAASEEKPLLHTWSLAVEEQYYVLFPVFLLLAWRFGKNHVFWTIVILAASSLALSEWGWRNYGTANFYLAPTRAWELLAGSIAAFTVQERGIRTNNTVSLLGLAAIFLSIFAYDEYTPFPSVYALLPVLGTILVLLFAAKKTVVAKFLNTKPLVSIGLISYSAYLWHQPIFAFARIQSLNTSSQLLMLTLSIASILIATLSWKFIEVPFRKSPIISRGRVLTYSIVITAAYISIGLGGHFNDGFASRFETPQIVSDGKFALPSLRNGFCFYDLNTSSPLSVEAVSKPCSLGLNESDGASLLLYGDSYAAQWEPYIRKLSMEFDLASHSLTTNWCFPNRSDSSTAPRGHAARDQCLHNQLWFQENFQKYDYIVLSGAWHSIYEKGLNRDFLDFVDFVINSNEDIMVIIIDNPPQLLRNSVENSLYNPNIDIVFNKSTEVYSRQFWREIVTRFDENSNVFLASRSEMGFDQYPQNKSSDGLPYSLDGGHISIYGSEKLYDEKDIDNSSIVLGQQFAR